MKVRYKKTGTEACVYGFNIHAMAEVVTGDDSAFISDLDVWLASKQCWKDMCQAFKDRDIIIDNFNTIFFEPTTEEDRERGFTL